MYTHILFVLQITHHIIYIYSVSPHRVEYLFYRTDSPPSYIYILHIDTVLHQRVNIVLPHRWPTLMMMMMMMMMMMIIIIKDDNNI